MENKPAKTALGLEENVESLLCYAAGWVSGLLFLLLEKENKNVRFHALQSFITFLGLTVVIFVLSRMPFLGHLAWLAAVCLWILLMIKAYKGERFKLPVAGDIAENVIGRLPTSVVAETQQQPPAQSSSQSAEEDPIEDSAVDTVSPSTVACEPPTSSKEQVLKAVELALSQHSQLSVTRSQQTDIEIKSILSKSDPAAVNKKVEYNACLFARESDRTVLLWEMVKRSSSDFETPGGFQTQADSFNANNGSNGQKKSWDSSQIRSIIEGAVKSEGWIFKIVLTKSKAMY